MAAVVPDGCYPVAVYVEQRFFFASANFSLFSIIVRFCVAGSQLIRNSSFATTGCNWRISRLRPDNPCLVRQGQCCMNSLQILSLFFCLFPVPGLLFPFYQNPVIPQTFPGAPASRPGHVLPSFDCISLPASRSAAAAGAGPVSPRKHLHFLPLPALVKCGRLFLKRFHFSARPPGRAG